MEDLDNHRIYYGVILLTLTICLSILIYCRIEPNGYQVYINGEPIGYMKNMDKFEEIQNSIYKGVSQRFRSYAYNDNISFKKVQVNECEFADENYLKEMLIEKSESMIPVTEVMVDSKPIGIFADEAEAKQALEVVEKYYDAKGKIMNYSKNNITFQKLQTKLKEAKTVDAAVNKIIEKNKEENYILLEDKVSEVDKKITSNKSTVSRGENTNGQMAAVSSVNFPTIGFISSDFGARWGKIHEGIDIGSNLGTAINSALPGKVSYAGWEEGYGNLICIQSQGDIEIFYGHCSKINVKLGQQVNSGELIGKVGSTGNSTGPHLHFEVRVNGTAIDPIKYLR